jgi:beta-fructofuranosidase
VEGDRFTMVGDDGACPYFWPIGDRHILLFFSHTSGGQALLGDYDKARNKFIVTTHARFNFGAFRPGGVHAPSATPDGSGGIYVIFNMNPAKDTEGWDQIMSLPRRLTLISRDELGVEPAGDIESLRTDHRQIDGMTLPTNQEIVLDTIQGNAMEIIAEIDTNDAPMVEMNVLRSPGKEEFTRIAFFRERGYRDWERYTGWQKEELRRATYSLVTIDSSYSSLLPDVLSRAPETGPVFLEPDEPLKLRVFVDRSVVEVFINGKQCLAMRVYPGREDSIGVSLRSQGSDSVLKSLDAWQMANIYEEAGDV